MYTRTRTVVQLNVLVRLDVTVHVIILTDKHHQKEGGRELEGYVEHINVEKSLNIWMMSYMMNA